MLEMETVHGFLGHLNTSESSLLLLVPPLKSQNVSRPCSPISALSTASTMLPLGLKARCCKPFPSSGTVTRTLRGGEAGHSTGRKEKKEQEVKEEAEN